MKSLPPYFPEDTIDIWLKNIPVQLKYETSTPETSS